MKTPESLYSLFLKHRKVSTDSRNLEKDAIFFALRGDNFDGNQFVLQAIENGAAAAVSDRTEFSEHPQVWVVDDTLRALQQLARMHRKAMPAKVIGITGSNGKTTTKELIAAVLSKKYEVLYTRGNLNNHIGVPLTLLQLKPDTELAVIEMGANHQGEIAALSRLAMPDCGLITNIGKAHLEGFGSYQNIIQTKGELYDYLKRKGGVVFLNGENAILKKIIGSYSHVEYGNTEKSYCRGTITHKEMFVGIEWECQENTGLAYSNLIGDYNFENIMAAICVGNYFGISSTIIDKTIASYTPSNNRSQWVRGRRNHLVLDFYNANPTSMAAAISNFQEYDYPKKCYIIGDMLELGDVADEEHAGILDMLKGIWHSDVFLVGKHFMKYNNRSEFLFFENVELLNKYLAKNPPSGSLILIKGSRGIRIEKCIDYL